MNKDEIERINAAVLNSEFGEFNKLDEARQIEVMATWTREIWDNFRMQNTVSEEDVFEPIFKLIDEP